MGNMTAPKPIADQLRALIQAELDKGTSMSEIARRANVSIPVISRFMGGGSLYLESLDAIVTALNKRIRIG